MSRSRRGMSTSTLPAHPENDTAVRRQQSVGVLAAFLLSDAITDVELVSRELSLSPAMLERMKRALDFLQCASKVLETGLNGQFAGSNDEDFTVSLQLRQLLDEWPDDFLEMLSAP